MAVSSSDGRLSVIKVKTQENHHCILIVTWFLAVNCYGDTIDETSEPLYYLQAEGAGLQVEASWEAHELEAWVVAKDRFQVPF